MAEGPPAPGAEGKPDNTGGPGGSLCVPASPGRLGEVYDVQKPVGKGGYAVVYKAIRREDGRVVAVKKVEIFEMSQKKRDRCLQEVTLLSQLSHPNIIQMLDAFIDENMLIIIFEWAPAGDLKRLIKKTQESGKTLDEAAIWGFFAQIVEGLRYMHQHRIMHRDIKPANVLVGANGTLKLGDLGLGRQLSEQTMEAFSKVGTPYFVSPEVVRGAGYDWKSDVWSLGCLLYELAALRSPFEMEGANLYDVFQKISKGDYEPLPADHFSSTLRQLVLRMLQVDATRRPELDEVWSLTHKVVQAQGRGRQDVHSAAEAVYTQLLVLEAACLAGSSSSSSGGRSGGAPDQEDGGDKSSGRRALAHGGGGSGSRGSGKVGSRDDKGSVSPPPPTAVPAEAQPPCDTLRLLHPAYFAEPLASTPGLVSQPGGSSRRGGMHRLSPEEAQRQQLGVFLHIYGWLLRVGGRSDLAATLDEHIELRTCPGRRAAPVTGPASLPASPPPAAGDSQQGGRRNISRTRMPSMNSTSSPVSNGHAPAPPPAQQAAMAPICTNILWGAEAVKKAAQAAGLSTEFAPVSAVASGYGRSACGLLQDAIDLAARKVPLAPRRPPKRAPEPWPAQEVEAEEEEVSAAAQGIQGPGSAAPGGGGGDDDDDDDAILTTASPMPLLYRHAEAQDEDEEGGGLGIAADDDRHVPPWGPLRNIQSALDVDARGGTGSGRGSPAQGVPMLRQLSASSSTSASRRHIIGASTRAADEYTQSGSSKAAAVAGPRPSAATGQAASRRAPIIILSPQVDPVAWRAELERLAPSLSRIRVPASSLGGAASGGGDWVLRWEKGRAALSEVTAGAPALVDPLTRIAAAVGDDLERIQSKERRIRSDAGVVTALESHTAARRRLKELQEEVSGHEELQQAGNAALSALSSQLEALQGEMADRAAALEGGGQIKQMQDAIRRVKKELGQMGCRIGVLQQQLAHKQMRSIQILREEQQSGGQDDNPDDS